MKRPISLVITPFFPSERSFRGPYVYDQVKAIERTERYQVVVLMGTSWINPQSDYEYGGIKVYQFKEYDLPSDMWPGANSWLSKLSFESALNRLGVQWEEIAIAHAHVTCNARFANFVKQKNPKCMTVLQHHGYDVLGLKTGRLHNYSWHRKRALSYGIRQCNPIDLHLGVSNEILKYLESYEGIKLKNKYVLYNGVDFTKFYPLKIKHITRTFKIGCIANFWELKDQITLIKAVEQIVNSGYVELSVSFIGSGHTRKSCEEYVRNNGLNKYFEFQNEVDHTQLNKYYNSLDLFVLPSYWDAYGCVYTEAYACDVPFVTAQGSGIAELLPEGIQSKWVIKPHDYNGLSVIIKNLVEQRQYDTISASKIQPLKTEIEINTLIKRYLSYLDKI